MLADQICCQNGEIPFCNEVVVSGDTLTLKGEKRTEKEQKEKNFYVSERSYGASQRSFYIPDGVDRDKLTAEFAKGVLTVTMPETAKAAEQAKKIEVKNAVLIQELAQYHKRGLLAKLRKLLPGVTLTDLKFRAGAW